MKKILCLLILSVLAFNISFAENQQDGDPMINSILTGQVEGDSTIVSIPDNLAWIYEATGGNFTEQELLERFDLIDQGDRILLVSKDGKEGWITRDVSCINESEKTATKKQKSTTYSKYKIIMNPATRSTTDAPTVINYSGSGNVTTLDKNYQDYGQPLLTDNRWTDCNVVVVSTGWQGGSAKLSSSDPGFYGNNLANYILNTCFNSVSGLFNKCKYITTSSHSNGGVMAAYTQTELDKMKTDDTVASDVKTTAAIISDGTVGRLKSLVDTLVNSGMNILLCASKDKNRSTDVTNLKDKLEEIGNIKSTYVKTKNGHGDCHTSEEIKELTKQEDLFPEYFNKNNSNESTKNTVKTAATKVTTAISGVAQKIANAVKTTNTTTNTAKNICNTIKDKITTTVTNLSNTLKKITK